MNLFDSYPPPFLSLRILKFFLLYFFSATRDERIQICSPTTVVLPKQPTNRVESSPTFPFPFQNKGRNIKFSGSLEIRLSTSISDNEASLFSADLKHRSPFRFWFSLFFGCFGDNQNEPTAQKIFYSHDPLGKIYISLFYVFLFSSNFASNNTKMKPGTDGEVL